MLNVLLVEDSIADSMLMLEILQQEQIKVDVTVVRDGIEAIKFLSREEPYDEALKADIVILDLNMPRMDGRELLSTIKQSPEWSTIPVLVLTTSNAEEDITSTYHLGANCYITKPIELAKFVDIVKSIDKFWFKSVNFMPNS